MPQLQNGSGSGSAKVILARLAAATAASAGHVTLPSFGAPFLMNKVKWLCKVRASASSKALSASGSTPGWLAGGVRVSSRAALACLRHKDSTATGGPFAREARIRQHN